MSDILNWITENNLFWLIIVPAAGWILKYFLDQRKENNASNRKDNVIKAIKEILNEENPKYPNKTRSITAIVKGVNTKISGNIEIKEHYIIEQLKFIGATQKIRSKDNEIMWTLNRKNN